MVDQPVVTGRWVMFQRWCDLLFAHWPIAPEHMRALVPEPLELDLYEGKAWLAVVPFRMSGIRLRGLPPVPGTLAFEELNVRTYVQAGGRRGVYFFSLDAANSLAVLVARSVFHLPYFNARMRLTDDGETIRYDSDRVHAGAPKAVLEAEYAPTSEVFLSEPGSLEEFLTERYCLFTLDERGVLRGDIEHERWPLQQARASFARNTMATASGFELPDAEPHLLFVRSIDVRIQSLSRLA